MNRRKFLTGLALSAGGILVSKELLGSKTYFLPPVGGWPHTYDYHLSFAFDDNMPVLLSSLVWISLDDVASRDPNLWCENIIDYRGVREIPT